MEYYKIDITISLMYTYAMVSVDMLSFGVTIQATVPQRSEIPEGLKNCPVF
jgi:hypothetical protein